MKTSWLCLMLINAAVSHHSSLNNPQLKDVKKIWMSPRDRPKWYQARRLTMVKLLNCFPIKTAFALGI